MKQRTMLICFTGVDGSGKTTQAKLLVDWLDRTGVKACYVWSGGELRTMRKFLLAIGKRALGTSTQDVAVNKQSYTDYQSRKVQFKENFLARNLWSVLTYCEHFAQIQSDILPKIRDGWVVVCDRYLWDSAVDLAILNHKNPEWVTNGLNQWIWNRIPRPAVTFFIDVPPEEALKRKNDIPSFDYVNKRIDFYRSLCHSGSFYWIDGCSDMMTIQNQVKCVVKNIGDLREQNG